MIVFPQAKINIGLRITGKRPDGYHNIETIFYPVGLRDALEFVISDGLFKKDIITVTGIDTGGNPEENLVIKSVNKLREKHSIPYLRIHLHKAIPVGAGLGGGSSDAACFMKLLNRCFGLKIDEHDLKSLALEVGSDCPFFINCSPAVATGRGEILKPIRHFLDGYYLVLLNPVVGINTREAYGNCNPEKPADNLIMLIDHHISEWKDLIKNDFEAFAFKKHPLIGRIKEDLYNTGALFSLMSGSGSSVYGIFSEKIKLPETLKDYVIWEGLM